MNVKPPQNFDWAAG